MPYQRLAEETLEQLRVIERALSIPDLDGEAMAALQSAADRLKAEYLGHVRQAVSEHRPEPPPLPAE